MFCFCLFRFWPADYRHLTISSIITVLLGTFPSMHLAQDNIGDRSASRATGPTATMSGPQLMSLLPLQSPPCEDSSVIYHILHVVVNCVNAHSWLPSEPIETMVFDVGNILDLSECSPIIVFVSFLSQIRWAKVEEKKNNRMPRRAADCLGNSNYFTRCSL